MNLGIVLSHLLLALLPVSAPVPVIQVVQASQEVVEEPTKVPSPPLPYILEKIALCESGGVQEDERGVVKGKVNPQDTGKFQINLHYHEKRAKELGIDLFTEDGNTEFARILFEEEGTRPWNASRSCWGKYLSTSTAQTTGV